MSRPLYEYYIVYILTRSKPVYLIWNLKQCYVKREHVISGSFERALADSHGLVRSPIVCFISEHCTIRHTQMYPECCNHVARPFGFCSWSENWQQCYIPLTGANKPQVQYKKSMERETRIYLDTPLLSMHKLFLCGGKETYLLTDAHILGLFLEGKTGLSFRYSSVK
jgi:hypothetical protein